jgi:hypothetical protein
VQLRPFFRKPAKADAALVDEIAGRLVGGGDAVLVIDDTSLPSQAGGLSVGFCCGERIARPDRFV